MGGEMDERMRGYVDVVYGAARRQMGDGEGAEDVAQGVFLLMVRKREAGKLPEERFMMGWLLKVTRYGVKEWRRREARRRARETRAAGERVGVEAGAEEAGAREVRGMLDEALMELGRVDREVVVRRYMRGEGLAEVGRAVGMNENTAGRRIARALEKLRRSLVGRGVTAPAGVVIAVMGSEALVKAPAAVGAVATANSAAASEIANGLLRSMRMVKVWMGAAIGAAVLGAAFVAMASRGGVPELPKVSARLVAATAPVDGGGAVAARPDVMPLEEAWEGMAGTEPGATRGMLAFARQRERAVAFLGERLQPLTISAEDVRKLVADLGSSDEAVWKPAMEKLEYFDPRLAIGLTTLMDEVTEEPARRRLVGVLSDREMTAIYGEDPIELRKFKGGMNFMAKLESGGTSSWWAEEQVGRLGDGSFEAKKKWAQAGRGIVVLGAMGTPEALAIVKGMATGHPERAADAGGEGGPGDAGGRGDATGGGGRGDGGVVGGYGEGGAGGVAGGVEVCGAAGGGDGVFQDEAGAVENQRGGGGGVDGEAGERE